MEEKIKEFRDGIFALRTRRFGTVAELMIEKLYKLGSSHNQFHDRFDENENKKIEIKFSTVMKENDSKINKNNVIEQCKKANLGNRALNSDQKYTEKFDCNIQQIKRKEFDILYYGLFFADKIAIFKIDSKNISDEKGNFLKYSDKQHKNNRGEGQFHLNSKNIKNHFDNYFVQWLTYEELYKMFS